MRVLSIAGVAVVISFVVIRTALSQDIPKLNIDPVCHGIAQQASNPTEKGDPDLAFAQCVQNENTMEKKLSSEWSTFMQSEKANCIGEETSVSLPSYTDLVTCLEMARDARALNGPLK